MIQNSLPSIFFSQSYYPITVVLSTKPQDHKTQLILSSRTLIVLVLGQYHTISKWDPFMQPLAFLCFQVPSTQKI